MIVFLLQSSHRFKAFLLVEEVKVAMETKITNNMRKREEVERAARTLMIANEVVL